MQFSPRAFLYPKERTADSLQCDLCRSLEAICLFFCLLTEKKKKKDLENRYVGKDKLTIFFNQNS